MDEGRFTTKQILLYAFLLNVKGNLQWDLGIASYDFWHDSLVFDKFKVALFLIGFTPIALSKLKRNIAKTKKTLPASYSLKQ